MHASAIIEEGAFISPSACVGPLAYVGRGAHIGDGAVIGSHVHIGEGAKVNAEIQAGTVIVNGQVEGNIKASVMVELHPPARVKGSIETPALSIDKGVIFEGTCKMESSPNGASKAPPSLGAPAVAK